MGGAVRCAALRALQYTAPHESPAPACMPSTCTQLACLGHVHCQLSLVLQDCPTSELSAPPPSPNPNHYRLPPAGCSCSGFCSSSRRGAPAAAANGRALPGLGALAVPWAASRVCNALQLHNRAGVLAPLIVRSLGKRGRGSPRLLPFIMHGRHAGREGAAGGMAGARGCVWRGSGMATVPAHRLAVVV